MYMTLSIVCSFFVIHVNDHEKLTRFINWDTFTLKYEKKLSKPIFFFDDFLKQVIF